MHPVTNYALPTLHITNYQQYIDVAQLYTIIMDHLPGDVCWPNTINVSIAYMQVVKRGVTHIATIALSILGKSYKVSIAVGKVEYDAQRGLDLNIYQSREGKDHDIHTYQRIFDAVISNKIKQIIKAITTAYSN